MAPQPKTATLQPARDSFIPRYEDPADFVLTDARLLNDSTPGGGDTTAEKTDLVKRSLRIDSNDGHIRNNSVLRESRSTHLFVAQSVEGFGILKRILTKW